MQNAKFLNVLLVLFSSLFIGCNSEKGTTQIEINNTNTLLLNGKFYTGNDKSQWAEAMVIKNGEITYIGSMTGVEEYKDNNSNTIDLNGKFVMPSFVESHLHPLSTAYDRNFKAALHELNSVDEYLIAIKKFAQANPDIKGVMGSGFVRTLFDSIGPRKELLDTIDSTRPIGIVSSDIHSMWVNSKVLELLNITKDTPNPNGGVIVKDPTTGEPTGLLQEDAAMQLAWDLFPQASKAEYKTSLLWVQEWMNSLGITTAHDAWMEFDPNFYEAYDELAKAGKLTVRFRGSWFVDPNANNGYLGEIDYGLSLAKNFTHPHFQVNSFKFLADNILEEETALLLEPYEHRHTHYGVKNWKEADMLKAFQKVNSKNKQIHVHTIGDAAAKMTLDAIEQLTDSSKNRHAMAHVQMIQDADITRMSTLGITAHLSQTWMVMNEDYDNVYLPYLGETRANNTYPQRSMQDANINITVASDLPTSEPNIMLSIYSGMTRASLKGETLPKENEILTLEQMLKAATINGAYANFLENEIGTLEVGKKADLVVLSQNLFNIETDEIPNVKIEMTFFEGKRVY
jgi:predicted amidohydrolase YtcJ